MKTNDWFLLTLLAAAVSLGLGGCFRPDGERLTNETQPAQEIQTKRGKGETYEAARYVSLGDEVCCEPTYWIGIRSHSADEAMLSQLGLTCGVVIDQVFPDAPSYEKLERHDVIHEVNGQKIGCARTLVDGINARKGQALKIGYIRQGQPGVIEIQPRPIQRVGNQIVQFLHVSDYEKMMGSFSYAESEWNGPQQEIELLLFRPGFRLPKDGVVDTDDCGDDFSDCRGKLTLEMAVSFRQNDSGEMVTVVRKGNEQQEFTRETLSNACSTVQCLVSHVLGQQGNEGDHPSPTTADQPNDDQDGTEASAAKSGRR